MPLVFNNLQDMIMVVVIESILLPGVYLADKLFWKWLVCYEALQCLNSRNFNELCSPKWIGFKEHGSEGIL